MDSIIQVAGRCNRHSREGFLGKVLIVEITNSKGYPTWRNIYDDILIDKTKEVLVGKHNFTEREVGDIVDEYYKKILEGLTSIPIFEQLSQGQWGEYSRLIDDDNEVTNNVTVFVEENNKLLPMLKEFEKTEWGLENLDEQKKLVQKIMQYAIEIPKNMIGACRSFCANLYTDEEEPIFRPIFDGRAWLLSKEAIRKEGGLYSPVLGFIPPETDDEEFSSIL